MAKGSTVLNDGLVMHRYTDADACACADAYADAYDASDVLIVA